MVKRSRTLPHLYLRNNGKKAKYTSSGGGNTPKPPYRDRKEHAEKLQRKIGEAIEKARQQLESRLSEIAVGQPGFYLEFEVTKDDANALLLKAWQIDGKSLNLFPLNLLLSKKI